MASRVVDPDAQRERELAHDTTPTKSTSSAAAAAATSEWSSDERAPVRVLRSRRPVGHRQSRDSDDSPPLASMPPRFKRALIPAGPSAYAPCLTTVPGPSRAELQAASHRLASLDVDSDGDGDGDGPRANRRRVTPGQDGAEEEDDVVECINLSLEPPGGLRAYAQRRRHAATAAAAPAPSRQRR